jgi:integrase
MRKQADPTARDDAPAAERQPRTTLAVFSTGKGSKVRVLVARYRGQEVVRVTWFDHSRQRTRDFRNTAQGRTEAKAFAKRVFEEKTVGRRPGRRTVRELWEAYKEAEFGSLRPKTRKNYEEHWAFFERFVGPRFAAETLTHKTLTDLKAALRVQRRPPLTVRGTRDVIAMVKRVYAWAQGSDLIAVNRASLYRFKVAKEERTPPPDEYTPEERDRLLAVLDPTSSRQWRPYVALAICGYQGVRQWAALHLEWPDVAADGRTVTWRGEWDKTGKTWEQPLRAPTRRALAVAMHWREQVGYAGPLVIPPGRADNERGIYTQQSLWAALISAAKRDGVPHKPRRGARASGGPSPATSGQPPATSRSACTPSATPTCAWPPNTCRCAPTRSGPHSNCSTGGPAPGRRLPRQTVSIL